MLKNLHFQFQTFQKLEYFWQTWKTLAPGLPVVHDKARAFHSFQDLSEDREIPFSFIWVFCFSELRHTRTKKSVLGGFVWVFLKTTKKEFRTTIIQIILNHLLRTKVLFYCYFCCVVLLDLIL